MSRFLFILALWLSPPAEAMELIPVNIKRIEKNSYQTTDEMTRIRTRHCDEDAYVDDALLSFEPYGLENTLTFVSGAVCEVKAVYDRAANHVTSSRQLRR